MDTTMGYDFRDACSNKIWEVCDYVRAFRDTRTVSCPKIDQDGNPFGDRILFTGKYKNDYTNVTYLIIVRTIGGLLTVQTWQWDSMSGKHKFVISISGETLQIQTFMENIVEVYMQHTNYDFLKNHILEGVGAGLYAKINYTNYNELGLK